MAGAAATAAAPFINLTRHPRSNLRHFSPNNVPCLRHQSFTSGIYHNKRSNPLISKVNSSIGGEPYEMDQAAFDGYGGIEEESDDDDAESSVDLLIRFLQSMFRKVSKRAKKASRSVLPGGVIPPQLVSFAVDGTLLLASLSVLKAFLEVICTLGGTVFAAILILRVIWAAVAYFQSSGNSFNQEMLSGTRTTALTNTRKTFILLSNKFFFCIIIISCIYSTSHTRSIIFMSFALES